MEAYTITAVCPIHNTGSDGGTRAIGVGEFIASPKVLSICTVHRNSHRDLDRWEHEKKIVQNLIQLVLFLSL